MLTEKTSIQEKHCVYSLQNNIAVILSFHSKYYIFVGTYKMATSTVACNVCSVRHITKSSAVWCSECDEVFVLIVKNIIALPKQHETTSQ
jgi:hypothetical protein